MNREKSSHLFRAAVILLILALMAGVIPVRADAPLPEIGEPVSSSAPGYQPAFTGCTRVNVPAQNAAYEQRVVELVNAERARVGMPPLKRNTDLDYAARYHAKDLQDEDYFAHDSYDATNMVCSWSERISKFYSGWNGLGENIAGGYSTPENVMSGWMGSSGHKDNILSTGYREMGVGYYYGSNGYHSYWVQDFGARGGVYPLIINNEAAQTSSPNVNLYIYGPGTEMRLRNDSDAWSAWQPYAANLNWTLKKVNGTRTVSVELRSGGSTYSSSDTIEAINIGPVLGNLPDAVTFIYDQSQARMIPAQVSLQPLNTGSEEVLTWQADAADAWIIPKTGGGNTPGATFSFAPGGAVLDDPGEHNTTLVVNVTSNPGVQGSPKAIQVKLIVVDALDEHVFLPIIRR